MSDYHRMYLKLADLLERGHCVQLEKHGSNYEVTVFEGVALHDHEHTDGDLLTETVSRAHDKALERWPKQGD